MLFRSCAAPAARRLLVEQATRARAALVAVRDPGPDGPGVLDAGRWDAAREDARPALAGYNAALAAVPRHDRVAREVGREWYQVVGMLLWYRQLGFQTAEDVAYQYLRSLPQDQCPATAARDIRQLRAAVSQRFSAANQQQIDHLVVLAADNRNKGRMGHGKRGGARCQWAACLPPQCWMRLPAQCAPRPRVRTATGGADGSASPGSGTG